jgi:hypothetical protein
MGDLVRDCKADFILWCVKEQRREGQDLSSRVSVHIGVRIRDGVSVNSRGQIKNKSMKRRFDRQNRFEELWAAAILFGNFNAHQPELKEFVDEVFVGDSLLVHLLDQKTDCLVGKVVDVVAEETFVFGERGQRSRNGSLQRGFGHGKTLQSSGWQTVDFS